MVGVRIVEVFFLAAWIFGFSLVWRQTRRALLLGVYVGCTLSWTHDWILASPEIWRMDFHPDTIWIATWGNRFEGAWAPLSYGAFFGMATFLWLRYAETPLRARIGAWRYILMYPTIFLANAAVEGAIIEWADTNRYHQPDQWLFFNIPWLHLVTTGAMLSGIIFFTVQAMRLLEYFGWQEFAPAGAARPTDRPVLVSPAGGATAPAVTADAEPAAPAARDLPRPVRTALFAVGVALPQAGFTFATMLALYLYDWVGVPPA